MSTSLFDPSWHRVAALRPRIRGHAEFHRHVYRGDVWFVLQDHSSERFHRFAPAAYRVIGLMDGRRTVQQIWDALVESDSESVPTQSEIIRLLGQLHAADVLMSDVSPDTAELLQRYRKRLRQTRWQKFKTPLAIRIPLLDPERFLTGLQPLVAPLFSPYGAVAWLLLVATAAVVATEHVAELTENVTERVLAPQNLLLLWLTFPVVKALHEFGHAFATKVWGGEVHEMGVMFLVLMPIPYVDASAASAFRQRHRRAIVGAIGMMVELLLASLALFVWLAVEPGVVRAIAYNVMLIAGVSTVLFNGNPLLRFDGYYIFADLIEIPNLAARSNRYVLYLVQKHLLGISDIESPVTNPSERRWFVFFAIASFLYRMSVYFVIVLFIAGKFFFVGVLLAIWAAVSMLVWPILKGLWFVAASSRTKQVRTRALGVTAASLTAIALLLGVLPLPYFSRAEGVVWIPDQAIVRVGTSGFLAEVLAKNGAPVAAGDPVLRFEDPLLSARIDVVRSQLSAAEARRRALQADDYAKAQIAEEEIERLRGRLAAFLERERDLVVHAEQAGTLYIPHAVDLPGRYLNQGAEVAYVVDARKATVRIAVAQDQVDLIRRRAESVDLRFAGALERDVPARLVREVPAATDQLPSAALSLMGGGDIATDPRAGDEVRALQNIFLFDLEPDVPLHLDRLGERVHVRFDHGRSPLATRLYRSLRQLMLGRFNV
ncbi:MAG: HlyD family efflux transporter periplasmic adaptor subunit [Gammaproteobacteria bacterium]|nr:HlyD family efflux transporter periplasmic adaptor subunit [Gammaproteobacteria bacterium]MCP5299331.1 HlyD family efflux transporter periplasmic adaptor subunit [Chromatiaceae bacterium]